MIHHALLGAWKIKSDVWNVSGRRKRLFYCNLQAPWKAQTVLAPVQTWMSVFLLTFFPVEGAVHSGKRASPNSRLSVWQRSTWSSRSRSKLNTALTISEEWKNSFLPSKISPPTVRGCVGQAKVFRIKVLTSALHLFPTEMLHSYYTRRLSDLWRWTEHTPSSQQYGGSANGWCRVTLFTLFLDWYCLSIIISAAFQLVL